ncbi:MAG: hypothetical protein JOZ33_07935, partial [Acidobacteriaceae bacterium]|nr:hypothetical protein [Acidobacteriaceae bacterium]
VRGPLVLFAIAEQAPKMPRQNLLAARQVYGGDPSRPAWEVQASSGTMRLLPFTAITDERYTTYSTVS